MVANPSDYSVCVVVVVVVTVVQLWRAIAGLSWRMSVSREVCIQFQGSPTGNIA